MTPQPNYVLIDTDAKKALFEPKQAADECWQPTTSGWEQTKFPYDNFSDQNQYRRLERNAWLPIKDRPVQYPAWLLHKDPRNETKWFGKCPLVGGDEGLMLVKYTHWLPAPNPPEAPVDASEEAFEKWWPKEPYGTNIALCKQAWQAGRDYERSKQSK